MKLLEWLKLPEVHEIENLDAPAVTVLHAEIIRKKPFLRRLYIDFYRQFAENVPDTQGKTLVELGSGGGFIKQVLKNAITSEVLEVPNVDRVFSALEMPFERASVDAFFMIDVLHHITEPRVFFAEAMRCLKNGGRIVMIEPANTPWSRFVYKNFHHEPFDVRADWELTKAGRLSHANGAMPWIIFTRDRKIFQKEFPSLKIVKIYNHTPFRYLLSGGLTLRQLVPSFAYMPVKTLECVLSLLNNLLGMFQTIVLQKVS
ncbi:MAG: class I SAM-dependent methyltransferase [Sedimentisphaerales bacterium]|nr:class I SAM-dependent methyltransferase [Sedimentisphaerales bacterium]